MKTERECEDRERECVCEGEGEERRRECGCACVRMCGKDLHIHYLYHLNRPASALQQLASLELARMEYGYVDIQPRPVPMYVCELRGQDNQPGPKGN